MRDDAEGMADLYHASYRRLVAQVYAFTTDLTEAQDAVQEAFARALARRNGLADIDSPEAWLRTVATNIVRRRWRRRQLLNTILLRERPLVKLVEEAPEPDRADLREALATIPRTYREVIVLHYLADLPVDEVANILEVPVGTVKSRLFRGREALKGLLDDVEAPPLDQVKQRAKTIRTRRRVAQATAAMAVVLVSAVVFAPWDRQQALPPGESPSPVSSWAGSGLTLRSVPEVGTVPDLPGTIIEFDVDGAGVLQTDEGTWARSGDGGQTWEIINYQREGAQPSPRYWRAKRPTPSGVWWQAGFDDGYLTVAHSRTGADNDWQEIKVASTEAGNLTATLVGEQLLVFTFNGRTISGMYLGGVTGFTELPHGGDMDIIGEPIVLPDGRWLVVDTKSKWQLSPDKGQHWFPAGGDMPNVGSLHMTSDGYVALDLFRNGWVATSRDGLNWQKLPIR